MFKKKHLVWSTIYICFEGIQRNNSNALKIFNT